MNSHVTDDFIACFHKLSEKIQRTAQKNYKLWKQNSHHPGLDFKKVHTTKPIYSVRISIGWRALGIMEGDNIIWFWIGPHPEYDRILKQL
jgi:hypothetical protein